ncbi:hypothetical protein [Streptomyces sp. NPDC059371]
MVHHAELSTDLAHLLRHCDHRILTAHADVRVLHPSAETSGESWADGRHR